MEVLDRPQSENLEADEKTRRKMVINFLNRLTLVIPFLIEKSSLVSSVR